MNTLEVRTSLARGSGRSTATQGLLELSHERAYNKDALGAFAAQIAADLSYLGERQDQMTGLIDYRVLAAPVIGDNEVKTTGELLTIMRKHIGHYLPVEFANYYAVKALEADHLDALPLFSSQDVHESIQKRTMGPSGAVRASSLRSYARRMYGASETLLEHRLMGDALRATYRADLAMFDAQNIEQSLAFGDWTFMSANVRWDLACWALREVDGSSAIYEKQVQIIRSTLEWALNSPDSEIKWPEIKVV